MTTKKQILLRLGYKERRLNCVTRKIYLDDVRFLYVLAVMLSCTTILRKRISYQLLVYLKVRATIYSLIFIFENNVFSVNANI